MTVTYSFFVHTATTSTPAELMKASKPVPPGVKKLHGVKRDTTGLSETEPALLRHEQTVGTSHL